MLHFLPHAWSDKMSDRAQREFSDESASCFELCDQTISFSESNTSTTVTTITATAEASESCSLFYTIQDCHRNPWDNCKTIGKGLGCG